MNILELAGIADKETEPRAAPRGKRPNPRKKVEKPKWGTPEEKYRRLCMLCLLCRYAYYHHATSIVTDQVYDRLERLVLKIEDKHRELIHPRSPTLRVGSTKPEDYPRSVRSIWEMHEGDPKLFVPIGKSIKWFMRDAATEFGV